MSELMRTPDRFIKLGRRNASPKFERASGGNVGPDFLNMTTASIPSILESTRLSGCLRRAGLGNDIVRVKKKRMTEEQVRALESSFWVSRKLGLDEKQELARRLGLQPRQVAVWFQNRRARSKIKHLEQEFATLKSQYDSVRTETMLLRAQVVRLTAELEAAKSAINGKTGDEETASVTRPTEPPSCDGTSEGTTMNAKLQITASSPCICCSTSSRTEQWLNRKVDDSMGFDKSKVNANDNLSPRSLPFHEARLPRSAISAFGDEQHHAVSLLDTNYKPSLLQDDHLSIITDICFGQTQLSPPCDCLINHLHCSDALHGAMSGHVNDTETNHSFRCAVPDSDFIPVSIFKESFVPSFSLNDSSLRLHYTRGSGNYNVLCLDNGPLSQALYHVANLESHEPLISFS